MQSLTRCWYQLSRSLSSCSAFSQSILKDPNPRIVPVFAQPQQSTNTGSLSRKSKRKPKFNTSPRIASEGEKMIAAERGLAQSRRLYAKGISRSSSPIFQFHNERLKFNIDTALHHEDDFYDEMQQFRSLHADLFMNEAEAERNERSQNHQKPRRSEVVQTPSSPEHNHSSSIGIDDRKLDAEVYTSGFFTINDRLFPERSQHSPFMDMNGLYADDDPPVKVSIPLSKLRTQSKSYKPHRRNSFDPTDSLDISRHLHKGYETSGILRNKTCFSDGRSYLRDHLIKTRRRGEKVQL
ncbi:hypothetical protein BC830DRAFT_754730 [Chytriomyces sp. MP71]|nr:hypothetical protein BC830DRAFT_754730 [Chytriomyces sp. MP71]